MKIGRGLVTAVLFLWLGLGAALAQTEQRVALVIGNGNYVNADKLKNPVNDAKAMAAMLGRAHFDVVEIEDATRSAMIEAVRTFSAKLSPGGVGLFFYAGHGIQAQGVNYLVPVEVSLSFEDDLRYYAFDVQDVLNKLEDARVRLSLVILDACRNNPFARSLRSTTRGLAEINPPRGTFIAYSTAPGKVAGDGNGANSVYTAELLKAMGEEPALKLQQVFERVTDAVELQTKNAQTPWTTSNFRGDFYFLGPTTVTVTPPPREPGVSAEAQEYEAWRAVANSTTPAPLEAFLKQFPSGVYAGIARAKIVEMTAPKQPAVVAVPQPQVLRKPAEEQEQAAWAAVANATTPAPLEAFLKRFPAGVFADMARARIEGLKTPKSQAAVVVPRPPPDAVLDPHKAEALVNEGVAYDKKGQFDSAIQKYDEAIRVDPKFAVAFKQRGKAYWDKGEKDRAIQDYDEAIRLDPKFALAFYSRGAAYWDEGQQDRAIQDYDEAIRLDPKFALAFNNRGWAHHEKGQKDRAIQDYDEAIRLDPKFALAFNNRGRWYFESGQQDRAIQNFDEAIRLDPTYAAAFNNRGAAYWDEGQQDRAIQDYDEAIRLDPKYAKAFNNRGIAYLRKGQKDRAIQDYDEAIRLDPKYAKAFNNRGLLLRELGLQARADADFAKARQLNPNLPAP